MGVSATTRASFALTGDTNLTPDKILGLLRNATENVRGGGKSLLTSGIVNVGAKVQVVDQSEHSFAMAVMSGGSKLCGFDAVARPRPDGRCDVTVGGLTSYGFTQSKLLLFIPIGPKNIHGMDLYKRFLTATKSALEAGDPSAALHLGEHVS